jgi:hypothetical protein
MPSIVDYVIIYNLAAFPFIKLTAFHALPRKRNLNTYSDPAYINPSAGETSKSESINFRSRRSIAPSKPYKAVDHALRTGQCRVFLSYKCLVLHSWNFTLKEIV